MFNYEDKKLLFIPIILSVIFALYVTITTNGPLSWDVYTHINYALSYMINGITTTDPLLNAPAGKTIGYAPLFHILLLLVSKITGISLIGTAQIFQVILPIISTVIIVYISYKLYDGLAAMISGLLLLSSFMFIRLILPIPETVSVIFFILGMYFYYVSIDKTKYSYALFSSIMGLFILSIHFSTFIYYCAIITVLSVIYLILSRKLKVILSYLLMIIPIIIVLVGLFMLLNSINPEKSLELLQGAFSIVNDPMSLFMGQKAMGIERYIKCIGIVPLISGIIGIIYSLKNRNHYFIALWTLAAFIVSNLHWIGIPVYTYRLLIYVIIPAVIVGGYGLSELIKQFKLNSNKTLPVILILLLIVTIGSMASSYSDESFKYSSVSTTQSTFHIAPPTNEEVEVINWLKTQNYTNNESVLTNNLFFGMILSSSDVIGMHYSFDVYASPNSHKSSLYELHNENIKYIIYDKSLVLNNSTDYDYIDVEYVEADYYPVYYYTKEINEYNFNQIQLYGTTKVFENGRFIVCEVN